MTQDSKPGAAFAEIEAGIDATKTAALKGEIDQYILREHATLKPPPDGYAAFAWALAIRDTPSDRTEAVEWARRSLEMAGDENTDRANAARAAAYRLIGTYHAKGIGGLEKSETLARENMQQAIENGDGTAAILIANMLIAEGKTEDALVALQTAGKMGHAKAAASAAKLQGDLAKTDGLGAQGLLAAVHKNIGEDDVAGALSNLKKMAVIAEPGEQQAHIADMIRDLEKEKHEQTRAMKAVAPYNKAMALMAKGRMRRAYRLMSKAANLGYAPAVQIKNAPGFKELHDTERFGWWQIPSAVAAVVFLLSALAALYELREADAMPAAVAGPLILATICAAVFGWLTWVKHTRTKRMIEEHNAAKLHNVRTQNPHGMPANEGTI